MPERRRKFACSNQLMKMMPRKHLQYGKAAEEAALSGASVNKEQKKINENLVFGGEVIPAGK